MAAGDLTTLASVKEMLQKQSSDTFQDTLLAGLITRVSTAFNRVARFSPAESGVAKSFSWRGGPLGLHPYFLRSASSVVIDSDTTSTTTVAATDYSLRPRSSVDGVYRWIHLPGQYVAAPGLSGIASDLMPEREITVTGDWGFTTVPADVQHWANITVVNWLRKDAEAFSTTFNLNDDRLERPEALPSAVRAALRRWAAPQGI